MRSSPSVSGGQAAPDDGQASINQEYPPTMRADVSNLAGALDALGEAWAEAQDQFDDPGLTWIEMDEVLAGSSWADDVQRSLVDDAYQSWTTDSGDGSTLETLAIQDEADRAAEEAEEAAQLAEFGGPLEYPESGSGE